MSAFAIVIQKGFDVDVKIYRFIVAYGGFYINVKKVKLDEKSFIIVRLVRQKISIAYREFSVYVLFAFLSMKYAEYNLSCS